MNLNLRTSVNSFCVEGGDGKSCRGLGGGNGGENGCGVTGTGGVGSCGGGEKGCYRSRSRSIFPPPRQTKLFLQTGLAYQSKVAVL